MASPGWREDRRPGGRAGGDRGEVQRRRAGKDPEFGQGDSAYDRYCGDPNLKNPNLTSSTAHRTTPSDQVSGLGTKDGLVSDEHGRVLREDGSVIEGLYVTATPRRP